MKTVLNLSLHLYSAPFYCEIKDFFVTKLFVLFPELYSKDIYHSLIQNLQCFAKAACNRLFLPADKMCTC